jgi:hypothetical protein
LRSALLLEIACIMAATRIDTRLTHNWSVPLLALWRRDDVTDSVVDFLPTKSIAVLPIVAKPLRAAQSRVLRSAVRRRGKSVPSPPTTRAFLDTLVIGEPQYFREDWEGGLEKWREAGTYATDAVGHGASGAAYTVKPFHGGGRCLEIDRAGEYVNGNHKGVSRRIHGENLQVTRLRVTMSFSRSSGAVGYVLLCGPSLSSNSPVIGSDISALQNHMGGPRFGRDNNGIVQLVWFGPYSPIRLLEVTPNTAYTVDATFYVQSATHRNGSVDISVNGQRIVQDRRFYYKPLSRVHAYNFSSGTSEIGEIEVWYEVAHSDQFSSGLPTAGGESEDSD